MQLDPYHTESWFSDLLAWDLNTTGGGGGTLVVVFVLFMYQPVHNTVVEPDGNYYCGLL